ncbi:MAG: thymidine phosphorylase [Xanthomonadales bacterium]
MFRAENIIRKKRDRAPLNEAEIRAFVEGIRDGSVTDPQIAAFTMATWFTGMTVLEQSLLTRAMRDSGRVLSWSGLNGPVLDKHSTGGVGDLVSLVLGPIIAASGGYVPMISGRGLGHTGGTLDKLESIPGFTTALEIERFTRLVRENGLAIVGQTDELAPADRRIYAVRDITATVDSPPLMISSILSKKLAEGLDGLVLDIKFGGGAFTPTIGAARTLAGEMTRVAAESGVRCSALLTDMNAPLAPVAGNALEIGEAIRILQGDSTDGRLYDVITALSGELLHMGALAETPQAGRDRARRSLASGAAAAAFARTVAAQGGPADLLERPGHYLPRAAVVRPVDASSSGYLVAIDARAIGWTVVGLGGGRQRSEDRIDPAVGLSGLPEPGAAIEAGSRLAVVHAANEEDWQRAAAEVQAAVTLAEEAPERIEAVRERIREDADEC